MSNLNNPFDALQKSYRVAIFSLSFMVLDMLLDMWHIPNPTLLFSVILLSGTYILLNDSPTASVFYIENPVLRLCGTLLLGAAIINFVFQVFFAFNPTIAHTPIDELFPSLFHD